MGSSAVAPAAYSASMAASSSPASREDLAVVLGEQRRRAHQAGRRALEAPRPRRRRVGADDGVTRSSRTSPARRCAGRAGSASWPAPVRPARRAPAGPRRPRTARGRPSTPRSPRRARRGGRAGPARSASDASAARSGRPISSATGRPLVGRAHGEGHPVVGADAAVHALRGDRAGRGCPSAPAARRCAGTRAGRRRRTSRRTR